MSPRSRPDRWRLHVTLVVGLTICVVGFAVELRRGLGGHLPAWVYVAEWPAFATIGAVMWWRLLRDDEEGPGDRPASTPVPRSLAPDDDPGLAAWEAYVARLESGQTGEPR
jgi:hypothetical protein